MSAGIGQFCGPAAYSRPWDASAAHLRTSFDLSSETNYPQGLVFDDDGDKMFVAGHDLYEYHLTRPYDVNTASYDSSLDISSKVAGPYDIAFNGDGTLLFIVAPYYSVLYAYSLTTAYDISTGSYDDHMLFGGEDESMTGVAFNSDGTVMIAVGGQNGDAYEYHLTTGYDISTATYNSSFSLRAISPLAVTFKPDGSRMYITESYGNNRVQEYHLTTGFDVSTASYHDSKAFGGIDNAGPGGVDFSGDGTKMFLTGGENDNVYEHILGKAFAFAGPVA